MKTLILQIVLCLLCVFDSTLMFPQNVSIDYQAWNLSNPNCNVFGTGTNVPATINGIPGNIMHYSVQGHTQYNTSQKALSLATSSSQTWKKGTKFRIAYNFKLGYFYTINITSTQSINTTGYQDGAWIRTDRTNSTTNNGPTCPGPANIDPTYEPIGEAQQYFGTSYLTYQFAYPSATSNTSSTLEITAMPAEESEKSINVYIRKITITETLYPPQFTLGSNVSASPCGSSSNVTFTVTNVHHTPSITQYVWSLGSSASGWNYGTNAAPATITTSTNTLTLTSQSVAALAPVSATVTAAGSTYSTNSITVARSEFSGSISGDALMCGSTGIYSIPGLPVGASVTWSALPTGIVSFSSSGSQTTLSRITNGTINMTATVNACGVTTNLPKPVVIGLAVEPSSIDVYGGGYDGIGCIPPGGKRAEAVTSATNTGYEWTLGPNITSTVSGGNNPFTTGASGFDIPIVISSSMTNSFVRVRAINSCGMSAYTTRTLSKCTDLLLADAFTVSPNPSGGEFSIVSTGDHEVFEVRLLDNSGNMKKLLKPVAPTKSTKFSASGLKADIYYIQIFNGKEWASKQIIIK